LKTDTAAIDDTWDLTELFADDDAFEAARAGLEQSVPTLERFKGRLASSAASLAEALDEINETYKSFALLRCYASLKADADTRDSTYEAMRQGTQLLATAISGRIAWLRPEILEMEPSTIEAFIEQDERLRVHAFFLRDLVRQRAHVLSRAEERLMAETGLITGVPHSLYNTLHNADLPRPEITLSDGEVVKLTPVAFQQHRTSSNRDDRARLFPAYFGAYADFDDTLGQNLYGSVKTHLFRSRVRGYESCLAAALDGDNVPTTVYRNLILQVRKQLPLLHRYLSLRAKALGLPQQEYIDQYCPLGGASKQRFAPRQARRLVLDALAPLGEGYAGVLASAFESRWIDWHPSPGKRSGAYATGWAYDLHPYVLLNYTHDLESVSTLAHEMGHALHSHFSNRAQPYATADYSIFVAEVASTLNESLLAGRLLDDAADTDERLFVLGSHLDTVRGTLFRQTMFAEYELEIHARAERGEVLTGPLLSEIYLRLLRDFMGHDEGVMRVDDTFAVEWAAVPHFYYGFYVYQYATGIVAATALAEALRQERPGAAGRYLEFLRSGGSDYPLELLRRAGVDLESAEPYDLTFAAMARHLDRLEQLLDERS
jgi:oligoendopeptidase F